MHRIFWPKATAKEGALGQMSKHFPVYLIHINFLRNQTKKMYNRANMVHSHHAFLILHAPRLRFLPIHTFLRNDSAKNFSGYCILSLLAKTLSQYTLVFYSTRICYWLNVHRIKCSIYFETPLDLQYFGLPFLF